MAHISLMSFLLIASSILVIFFLVSSANVVSIQRAASTSSIENSVRREKLNSELVTELSSDMVLFSLQVVITMSFLSALNSVISVEVLLSANPMALIMSLRLKGLRNTAAKPLARKPSSSGIARAVMATTGIS